MFTRLLRPLASLCLFVALSAPAAVLYVDLNSTNPVSPFSTWATAATNIQDAVDATTNGDLVVVTNGVYQAGGRVAAGITNRVAVAKAVTVQSVNGPQVTVIQGYQVPGATNGTNAIRCVFLTNNAVLAGFTLTNGATHPFFAPAFSPATLGGGVYCNATNATVSNCIITGNSSGNAGGGAEGGTLNNCTIVANTSAAGGGADGGTLINCLVVSNTAGFDAGGVSGCKLSDCLIIGNSVGNNGGEGGGSFGSTLNNCTLAGNSAPTGGGAVNGILNNCIVYYNSGGNYASDFGSVTLNYCCTTPLPGGLGNITNEPAFMNLTNGDYHLRSGSACINAGNNAYVSTTSDLDGRPRISGSTVDMGAYELQFHYVDQNSTNPISPFSSWATAATNIQDAVDAATNGDQVLVTNGIYQYGGRIVQDSLSPPGHYLTNRLVVTNAITVQSVNGPASTIIQGFQVPGTIIGLSAIRCAYLARGAQLIGFTLTNGATSPDLQLISANCGGGVYSPQSNFATNATLSNCVISGNSASEFGGGAFSCTLINCTLTNNFCTDPSGRAGLGGGAAFCALTGCIISSNAANVGGGEADCILNYCTIAGNSALDGGGLYEERPIPSLGTINFCIITGNFATNDGGGAYESTLNNCILAGNVAGNAAGAAYQGTQPNLGVLNCCLIVSNSAPNLAGGVYGGTLNNCTVAFNSGGSVGGVGYGPTILNNSIIYSNKASTYPNYQSGTLNYCCTTPLPTNGLGNITNAPLFVNPAAGDFHLQSNSPCINAGYNPYVSITNNLDGNPRISGGTVDIGAYEFQNPASIISYAWLDQYGLPTDGSADFLDSDHNGMNNWQKWIAGLDPTNPSSVLQMLSPVSTTNPPGLVVTWQSAPNVNYYLQRATNLSAQPAFQPLATNLPGQPGTTSFTDTNAPAPGPYFYRVGVQHP